MKQLDPKPVGQDLQLSFTVLSHFQQNAYNSLKNPTFIALNPI